MLKYQVSRKSVLLGAELFYAEIRTDGRTDMTKVTVAFRSFAKASKNKHSPNMLDFHILA